MRIYVTRMLPGIAPGLLQEAFGPENVTFYPMEGPVPRTELLESVQGVDAVLAILTERIDAEFLDAAGPQLRIVANMAVGYDNIDVPAATARRVPVTNTPGVLTETTADLAFALIMAASRRFSDAERFLRAGEWKYWSPSLLLGADIHGKTLGIFGMGRIGQATARRARGFGMRVHYHNRTPLPEATEKALGAVLVDKQTLLTQSDIISVHCPLSPETRHAFGPTEFAAMKPSAVFVNTARGPIVDERALAAALREKQIFAAGIDVFEEEPKVLPELLACENAVLLPHVGSATFETRGKMAEVAARNIIARLQGQRPPNCVNPEVL